MTDATSPADDPAAARAALSRFDVVIAVAVLLASSAIVLWMTNGLDRVMYDSFRDMAWAENVVAGRICGCQAEDFVELGCRIVVTAGSQKTLAQGVIIACTGI